MTPDWLKPDRPTFDARLETPIYCVGWIVVTEITDGDGNVTVQHGNTIHRSKSEASKARRSGRRKLRPWERAITRTLHHCRTAFPLADVLEGRAQRWDDYLAATRPADKQRKVA